jgi:antitoxin HigA-1
MERLPNIHPGDVLREEFLEPLGMTAYRLSKEIGVPQTRISEILHGRRSITADTALRLAKHFQTTPHFWMNLQTAYDLEEAELAEEKNANAVSTGGG